MELQGYLSHPLFTSLHLTSAILPNLISSIRLGSKASSSSMDIRLDGDYILSEHCIFTTSNSSRVLLSVVKDSGAMCYVNGRRLTDEPVELKQGSRVILGKSHVFRFNNPSAARRNNDNQDGLFLITLELSFFFSCIHN